LVFVADFAFAGDGLVEAFELGDADSRLQVAHAEVPAQVFMDESSFLPKTEIPQIPAAVGQGIIVGQYHPAFAGGDVFVGIKAESADVAEAAARARHARGGDHGPETGDRRLCRICSVLLALRSMLCVAPGSVLLALSLWLRAPCSLLLAPRSPHPVRLPDDFGGVFDDVEVVFLGKIQEGIHVHWQSVDVDGHDGFGAGSDFGFNLGYVHVPGG
jgi:hypothetical protein